MVAADLAPRLPKRMAEERQAGGEGAVDEGAWVYLISKAPERNAPNPLHDRVVEACEAGGWPAVAWPSPAADDGDPGHLFEGVSHAVEHADCVVALIGDAGETADAELALAYSHRRPIVGLRLSRVDSSASAFEEMLGGYERSRVIACDSAEECAVRLRATFSDPDFADTIRTAAGEYADDA